MTDTTKLLAHALTGMCETWEIGQYPKAHEVAAAREVLAAFEAQQSSPCVDPFCACRGGPCAECQEGQALSRRATMDDLAKKLESALMQIEAYKMEMAAKEKTHLAVVQTLQKQIDQLKVENDRGARYSAWASSELDRQAEERNNSYQCGEL